MISELNLRGDEKILDLGCGDGALTARLAELVPDGLVIGIDGSEGMIEVARKDHEAENLKFALMDINDIDFKSEFEVVFSNATLHWIKDHGNLLTNVFRSLKDRGRARFQFAADGNCPNLISVVRKAMSEREYAAYFKGFDWPWYIPTAEQYSAQLDQVPFQEKKVWCENADRYFTSVEEMVKWIDQPSIVPFSSCVAAKDRARFRDAVVEQMVRRTIQDDGRCFESFRRINVFARK